MITRPRRLRQNPVLRKMVRETRMDASSLIYPMFVRWRIWKKRESEVSCFLEFPM